MHKKRLYAGLSMIEILIVTAVVGILVILAISMLPKQVVKARDGRRKSDLQKIKIAFENYYSDNDCYPAPEILNNCNSSDLSPYLASIPCDPQTKTKYLYAPEEGASCPHYYRVFSNLEVHIDPIIEELGCHTSSGCGAYRFFSAELGLDALQYNYGVSEGVPVYVTEGNVPPGTEGWCCPNYSEPCNAWTISEENVCTVFYFGESECNAACGYTP